VLVARALSAVAGALDVVALALSVLAALCAWRSWRWLERHDGEEARSSAGALGDPSASDAPLAGATPLVSILVPARDEESNIGACLAGALAQRAPAIEVLVLDDGSTDRTAALARAAIAGDPRGRVLAGAPLPAGWVGKNHACHQLAAAARGEWLLFLDADTRLGAGGVVRALAAAESADADLVSFLPLYRGVHWTNRLVVPWLYFFLTALVPLPEVRRWRHPRLAVANGQAILVRRAAYERAGGHAAVRDHVIEDVSLAVTAKERGVPIALLDGHRWLSCAMYDSFEGFVRGFAKSFHSAARRYPLQWAALSVLLVLVGIWPWLRLATADPLVGRVGAVAGLLVLTLAYGRLLAGFRQSALALVVWPATLAVVVAVSAGGGLAGLTGRTLTWRGRPVGGVAPS
jgi:glycosyltransferase involved in cell wall biosynthesis